MEVGFGKTPPPCFFKIPTFSRFFWGGASLKTNCQDARFWKIAPFLTFQYVAGFPCPSPAAGPARWNPVPLPGSSPARFCKLVSDQTMRLCLPVNLVNNAPHYNIKTKRYSVEVVDW